MFNTWINKKDINKWIFSRIKIFRKKSESWNRFIELCNKTDSKNAKVVDKSSFAKKVDLANLKSDVDRIKNIEDKTLGITNSASKASFNAKIN